MSTVDQSRNVNTFYWNQFKKRETIAYIEIYKSYECKPFNWKWIKFRDLFLSFCSVDMQFVCKNSSAFVWNQTNRPKRRKSNEQTMEKFWTSDACIVDFCKGIPNSKRLNTYEKSIWVHASERIFCFLSTYARMHVRTHMKINKCLLFDVEFWK